MKLIIKGIVQGVGFRPTVYRVATQLGLKGYVVNKGSEVEVVIDRDVDTFLTLLQNDLPSIAEITDIIQKPDNRTFPNFRIIESEHGEKQSPIPPDISICDQCLRELFEPANRRYHYPFTNCTICGARYSLITDVPYDRERTAMNEFHLCSNCTEEYENPKDRRYHAQTISCPICGPLYHLYDKQKKDLGFEQAVERFAKQIDNGAIGVIKSWGGMHLCCRTNEIQRFRTWYKRPQKPFAVMMRDITTARLLTHITEDEEKILLSNKRPIVLVRKKKELNLAPGLDQIGVYLPYTGLHYLLFSCLETDSLLMTSANIPGEPMITRNDDAFSLGADYYLLHNRDIPNRIDDSVVKLHGKNTFFLRKSRGYVPDPIRIPYPARIVSVGAGENITGAVSNHNHVYMTPYIGDSQYHQTVEFLKQSLNHLITLTMEEPEIDAVALDLHPGYGTRPLAQQFARDYHVPLVQIQHHWAHAASLLLDNNVEESVILTLDGLGYGTDGTYWGGEILHTTYEGYKRVGHLEPIPLLGGDQATRDPRRLVFALLQPYGKEPYFTGNDAGILRKMIPKAPRSSSMGRILDALSCYLDICTTMTYDGEPAMKLEKYLARGVPKHLFHITQKNGVVNTPELFHELSSYVHLPLMVKEKADLAVSFVKTLIECMTDIAIQTAEKHDLTTIGVTGGVSYNIPLVKMIENHAKIYDKKLLLHHRIPNGDGGIAIGQNLIAGHTLSHLKNEESGIIIKR